MILILIPRLIGANADKMNGLMIPNVKPTFKPMGATAKVDFLLIIEKIGT